MFVTPDNGSRTLSAFFRLCTNQIALMNKAAKTVIDPSAARALQLPDGFVTDYTPL